MLSGRIKPRKAIFTRPSPKPIADFTVDAKKAIKAIVRSSVKVIKKQGH